MARQYLASEKLPLRFYLEAGTFEIDKKGEGGDVLEPTRHLRDVLRAKVIRFIIDSSSADMMD